MQGLDIKNGTQRICCVLGCVMSHISDTQKMYPDWKTLPFCYFKGRCEQPLKKIVVVIKRFDCQSQWLLSDVSYLGGAGFSLVEGFGLCKRKFKEKNWS